ncbi:D-2-hydroxyacid dehydrogenase [Endozoicomonas sp. G2_1]|uniref:D-2-hydroxyacid dehydrogenase n=1 Tax=Endozoicomonas sp. G2_1 TaxID=2821091 RepID=UPI001AD9A351|nr:D-2-hydroxyacid dehydrogenase [Endozoicomonas sp. G2_1]MBO9489479.1 D-2-hydroxyacid dehydrogenase [Endozoicomonas sp. G2_1]
MRAVFLDQATFSSEIDITMIEQQVSKLTCYPLTNPEQIIEHSRDANIIITNKVVLNRVLLTQLPELKLICIAATGTNNVDLASATELGICVTNITNYANQSVSQYVFAQLLNHFSHISDHNQNVRNNLWQQHHSFCLHGKGMEELAGKTIAIIGYGSLGQAVAERAKAFDLNVMVSEHCGASKIRNGRVSFEQALSQADIISLHCPQTADTTSLINEKSLALVKPSAVIVNTARGGLINNDALLAALREKRIAAAILDVLDVEPPPADHPLIANKFDNLIITAHIAWASKQAQQRLIDKIAENISAFAAKEPINVVN